MDNAQEVTLPAVEGASGPVSVPVGRPCPEVMSVACHLIPDAAILDQKCNLLDVNVVTTHLLHEGRLSRWQIDKILGDAESVMAQEPNLVRIDKNGTASSTIWCRF